MVRAGQIVIDKDNNRHLVYGLAEQEGTGESLVIFRNVNSRQYFVRAIHKFENEYSLVENAI